MTQDLAGLMSKCPDGTPRKLLWTRDPEDEASIPLTIAKSDGGFGYDTSDLATIRSVCLYLMCMWRTLLTLN